ncbi:hypothetical protein WN55_02832 [Dufourea novaeangliae]|uniref:Uncharacterized protein n=1 Tax=Dufourea novaeangliae TaxID=178035 RepID=A0A154PK06_DUFNO|nr:hypothetical protein WN55_02832 [Dufourea novaeangliae]
MQKSVAFVKKCQYTGTVDDIPERGRSRDTSIEQDRTILRLFQRYPSLTLRHAEQ